MKSSFAPLCFVFAITASLQSAEFNLGGQKLTVPDGFEIELVTGTNLVERPISMDYDEQGRLYVTDSSGSNEKVAEQLEKKPHRVLRLEDTNGDGVFDKSSVFADKLMFPEGCMWFDGSLYVSAPPSIWKLTDTNNDGVADVRSEWHEGKTLTGCANDLHGPYLGPDGFIYWCKGAFAEQTYQINGKPFTTRASHVFRARPDHTLMEPVLTGGMDNPVGLAFSPEGERFMGGTFFEPHIPGRRDGVIHDIYGGVWGKPHPDVLDSHIKTGDLMPIMIHLGPAATASVISYRSGQLGDQYRNNLFVCNFNLHNVTVHSLKPKGATFEPTDSVFLSSDNPDFHPTCILEDADGSLLVVDTGGWYKICCPTSQLYKPDMLGAIYRIRRKGTPKVEDARGLNIKWQDLNPAELVKYLDDKRPYVVEHALRALAKQGDAAVKPLTNVKGFSVMGRQNAVWALARIPGGAARAAVRDVLYSESYVSVLKVAATVTSLWRDSVEVSKIQRLLASDDAQLSRGIIELLGRGKNGAAIPALLKEAEQAKHANDRVWEHSLIYALIELGDRSAIESGLTSQSVLAQRAALIALDQIGNGELKPQQVAPLLLSTNAESKQTASWLVGRHPEWGEALADLFGQVLTKGFKRDQESELQKQLAQLASNSTIQSVLATNAAAGPRPSKLVALRAMAQAGLKEAPPSWATSLAVNLPNDDGELLQQVVNTARALSFKQPSADLVLALMRVANDNFYTADIRLTALAAIPIRIELSPELFEFCRENLQPGKPVSIRGSAATVLVKTKLAEPLLLTLADVLKDVGPMELTRLLDAFGNSTNETLGLKLVSSLKEAKAVSSLRAEAVKPKFAKFPPTVQSALDQFLSSLNVDAAKQGAHVDQLLASLKDGDIRRGQSVFNSPKAACASCHRIGYGGGQVGPDLTRIGQVRSERDLLEAIVYPSASFVRSFEPMIVVTKSGDDFSGIVKKDTADEVILVSGPNAEVTIARKDISEMRPGTLSVMPQGLDEQLGKQELADLIAFLKATRW